jgi:hypothetical protein
VIGSPAAGGRPALSPGPRRPSCLDHRMPRSPATHRRCSPLRARARKAEAERGGAEHELKKQYLWDHVDTVTQRACAAMSTQLPKTANSLVGGGAQDFLRKCGGPVATTSRVLHAQAAGRTRRVLVASPASASMQQRCLLSAIPRHEWFCVGFANSTQ